MIVVRIAMVPPSPGWKRGTARPTVSSVGWPSAITPVKLSIPLLPRFDRVDTASR